MNDPLLTVAEVAPMIRKTEKALRAMITQGTAPRSAKVAGRRLFRQSDVDAYVANAFANAS
ncbi:helix-turn-helix domain-containing protein [Microbacterium sp. BWR-S6Y]|uniref:helix-turn-helix transcriptional regulator n=1 Tax=Microbacterium sp. BWR-S6Y TaxID=3232073 RepID=UPI0035277ADD